MKSKWLQILFFPVCASALGLVTMLIAADGFRAGDEARAGAEFVRVTWQETEPRVQAGEWLLVDARDEEQFNARHIPGALSLPSNAYPEMLEFFAEDHGKTKTVVVYCGTEECDLSTELARRLRDEVGYADIRILDGGFLAWQRQQ